MAPEPAVPQKQNKTRWLAAISQSRWLIAGEWLLMLGVIALLVGPPPLANEPHYMTQAKDAWDSSWLPGDLFLDSKDAHVVFYNSVGWLTRYFSLTTATWIGRGMAWGLLTAGWICMTRSLVKLPLVPTLTFIAFEALIYRFELAGEWVVGGVEAKVFAFGLVFLATAMMMNLARREHGSRKSRPWNWFWVGPLLGIASAFHVLVGGWATLCSFPVLAKFVRGRRSLIFAAAGLILGGGIALTGVLPGMQLGEGSTPEEISQGTQLHVFLRLAHHQCFATFNSEHRIRFAALSMCWLVLAVLTWRNRALRVVHILTAGSLLLTCCGIAIEKIYADDRDAAANLLRFYWYRMSDALVPAAVSLSSIVWLRWLFKKNHIVGWVLTAALAIVVVGHYGREVALRLADPYRSQGLMLVHKVSDPVKAARIVNDWRSTCQWIKANTPEDARFITPRRQQTFKWYAERVEIWSWKDIPQNGAAVLEWKRRMDEIYPRETLSNGLAWHGEAKLLELANKYDADYIVIDRTRKLKTLNWKQVYPAQVEESYYAVYEIPRTQAAD